VAGWWESKCILTWNRFLHKAGEGFLPSHWNCHVVSSWCFILVTLFIVEKIYTRVITGEILPSNYVIPKSNNKFAIANSPSGANSEINHESSTESDGTSNATSNNTDNNISTDASNSESTHGSNANINNNSVVSPSNYKPTQKTMMNPKTKSLV